jgi:bifunctional ADP-heptose synthase (sugar kinase/adenylyltransferase)
MVPVDTRTKIIDAAEARRIAAAGAISVSGYFDPLVSSHAKRLAELKIGGAKLLVVIATPTNAILPARARAELVAALAVVDYVTETDGNLTPQIRLEHEDEARLDALIEHVHARQRAAG